MGQGSQHDSVFRKSGPWSERYLADMFRGVINMVISPTRVQIKLFLEIEED